MNISIGGQLFLGVQIPLLWGTRAIILDSQMRISIIDLENEAKLEVLGGDPAPDMEYSLNIDGFTILRNEIELYKFNPKESIVSGISIQLPTCQITPWEVKVGHSTFSGNLVVGMQVGIFVNENGIGMGGRVPPNLAKLVV